MGCCEVVQPVSTWWRRPQAAFIYLIGTLTFFNVTTPATRRPAMSGGHRPDPWLNFHAASLLPHDFSLLGTFSWHGCRPDAGQRAVRSSWFTCPSTRASQHQSPRPGAMGLQGRAKCFSEVRRSFSLAHGAAERGTTLSRSAPIGRINIRVTNTVFHDHTTWS